jgi:hypothetical protein
MSIPIFLKINSLIIVRNVFDTTYRLDIYFKPYIMNQIG